MRPSAQGTILAAFLLGCSGAAAPDAARASEVSSRIEPGFCDRAGCTPDTTVVTFAADPDEINRVSIRGEGPQVVVIEDAGAAIRTSGACTSRSEHTVVCRGSIQLSADLGDGDDTAIVRLLARVLAAREPTTYGWEAALPRSTATRATTCWRAAARRTSCPAAPAPIA